MKKTLILSTVMLSLLASPIASANNIKHNNTSHQRIEKTNSSLNMSENQIADILNSNQLYKLSDYYVALDGQYGQTIIVFNNKSERNKINKIVNKIINHPLDVYIGYCEYLTTYLNKHHCIIKVVNSQKQNVIVNSYKNNNINNQIINQFKYQMGQTN